MPPTRQKAKPAESGAPPKTSGDKTDLPQAVLLAASKDPSDDIIHSEPNSIDVDLVDVDAVIDDLVTEDDPLQEILTEGVVAEEVGASGVRPRYLLLPDGASYSSADHSAATQSTDIELSNTHSTNTSSPSNSAAPTDAQAALTYLASLAP
jgi:hypothetical protein